MKLSSLNGVAHDLANHLQWEILFGRFKDGPAKTDTNVLNSKTEFEKYSAAFVHRHLPKGLDAERIKEVRVKVSRTMTTASVNVTIVVDNKEFKGASFAMKG